MVLKQYRPDGDPAKRLLSQDLNWWAMFGKNGRLKWLLIEKHNAIKFSGTG
jgi:hypothetical protein